MNRKLAALIVVILIAAAGGLTYYAWVLQTKPVPSAEAVVLVGDPKNTEAVNTFIQIFRSEPVLLNAARRIKDGKSLPENLKERAAYLAARFDAGRAGAKEGNVSNAIRLSFRDDDGELAKDILSSIIMAFQDEMDSRNEEAAMGRIQLLKNAIAQNTKKTRENLAERDAAIIQARKVSNEDSKTLEKRLQKAFDLREQLRIQQRLAETPEKAAKYDSVINETSEKITKDAAKLTAIAPLAAKVEVLEKYIEARTKLVDGYEAELLSADLKRAEGRIQVVTLQPPTVASQK